MLTACATVILLGVVAWDLLLERRRLEEEAAQGVSAAIEA
jgi:hypothetical protein